MITATKTQPTSRRRAFSETENASAAPMTASAVRATQHGKRVEPSEDGPGERHADRQVEQRHDRPGQSRGAADQIAGGQLGDPLGDAQAGQQLHDRGQHHCGGVEALQHVTQEQRQTGGKRRRGELEQTFEAAAAPRQAVKDGHGEPDGHRGDGFARAAAQQQSDGGGAQSPGHQTKPQGEARSLGDQRRDAADPRSRADPALADLDGDVLEEGVCLEVDGAAPHGHEGEALLAELLVDDLHHRRQHEEVRRQTKAVATARELLRQLGGRLAERCELSRQGLEKLDSRLRRHVRSLRCVAWGRSPAAPDDIVLDLERHIVDQAAVAGVRPGPLAGPSRLSGNARAGSFRSARV
jgi:hypothetical protein